MPEFTYFGESFRFSESVDPFAITEFAELLEDSESEAQLRGFAVTWRLALSCVAEEDQARFRQVSRKNKATAQAYMQVFREWTADESERPTTRPSDSSDGPSVTPLKSETLPDDAVTSQTERPPVRVVRPDLALALARSA